MRYGMGFILTLNASSFRSGMKAAASDVRRFEGATTASMRNLRRHQTAMGGYSRSMMYYASATYMGVAALGALVKAAGKFDYQARSLAAIMKTNAEAGRHFHKRVMELNSSLKEFSPTEITKVGRALAQAGYDLSGPRGLAAVPAILDAVTASMGALSVDAATELGINLERGFGRGTRGMRELLDVAVEGANMFPMTLDKITMAMGYATESAVTYNQSLESVIVSLGALMPVVKTASKAGVAYRNTLAALVKPTTVEFMQKHGIRARDDSGQQRRAMDIVADIDDAMRPLREADRKTGGQSYEAKLHKMFGIRGKSLFAAYKQLPLTTEGPGGSKFKTSRDAYAYLETKLMASAGAAKDLADRLRDSTEVIDQRFNAALETLAISLGSGPLEDVFNTMKTGFAEMFEDVAAMLGIGKGVSRHGKRNEAKNVLEMYVGPALAQLITSVLMGVIPALLVGLAGKAVGWGVTANRARTTAAGAAPFQGGYGPGRTFSMGGPGQRGPGMWNRLGMFASPRSYQYGRDAGPSAWVQRPNDAAWSRMPMGSATTSGPVSRAAYARGDRPFYQSGLLGAQARAGTVMSRREFQVHTERNQRRLGMNAPSTLASQRGPSAVPPMRFSREKVAVAWEKASRNVATHGHRMASGMAVAGTGLMNLTMGVMGIYGAFTALEGAMKSAMDSLYTGTQKFLDQMDRQSKLSKTLPSMMLRFLGLEGKPLTRADRYQMQVKGVADLFGVVERTMYAQAAGGKIVDPIAAFDKAVTLQTAVLSRQGTFDTEGKKEEYDAGIKEAREALILGLTRNLMDSGKAPPAALMPFAAYMRKEYGTAAANFARQTELFKQRPYGKGLAPFDPTTGRGASARYMGKMAGPSQWVRPGGEFSFAQRGENPLWDGLAAITSLIGWINLEKVDAKDLGGKDFTGIGGFLKVGLNPKVFARAFADEMAGTGRPVFAGAGADAIAAVRERNLGDLIGQSFGDALDGREIRVIIVRDDTKDGSPMGAETVLPE